MKLELACAAGFLSSVVVAMAVGSPAQAVSPPAIPVVVELFTSEGCSDCPPADAVLAKLAAQPIPGVQVIALGEHVDYWDRQGWRDPFSSPAFTQRQVDYTGALHVESPYTPQMIVNGRDEFVGGNYSAATAAVGRAAREQSRQLHVSLTVDRGDAASGPLPVRVGVEIPAGVNVRGAADVFVAVTEDNLSSHVTAGENRGRDLRHAAVVRALTRIGGMDGTSRTWSAGGEVSIDRAWKTPALHVIAFVQDHASRAILGAASAPF